MSFFENVTSLILVVLISASLSSRASETIKNDPVFCSHAENYVVDLAPVEGSVENVIKLSNGDSIFYRQYSYSQNAPLVILVPGLPATLYLTSVFNDLAKLNYNVIMFDFAGKMNSHLSFDKSDKNYIMKNFNELVDILKLKSYAHWNIVGTSMGSILAAQIAVDNSSKVNSLSLINPIGLKTDWTMMERLAKVPVLSQLGAVLTMKYQVKGNLKKAIACPEKYENLIQEQEKYLSLFKFRSKLNYLNVIANFSMSEYTSLYQSLNEMPFSILVTGGESKYDHWHDQFVQLKDILKQATFVEMKYVSHFPFIERPIETLQLLLQNFEHQKTDLQSNL